MKENGLFAEIYAIVKQIPRGQVATYGQIAARSGNPRRARLVGYALVTPTEYQHRALFK